MKKTAIWRISVLKAKKRNLIDNELKSFLHKVINE